VRLKEVRTSHGTFWACENCGGETERWIPEAFFFKFEKNNVDTFSAPRLKTQFQLHFTPLVRGNRLFKKKSASRSAFFKLRVSIAWKPQL